MHCAHQDCAVQKRQNFSAAVLLAKGTISMNKASRRNKEQNLVLQLFFFLVHETSTCNSYQAPQSGAGLIKINQ